MIDLGFEVFNYNLHLLPGTEMDEDEYEKNISKKQVTDYMTTVGAFIKEKLS